MNTSAVRVQASVRLDWDDDLQCWVVVGLAFGHEWPLPGAIAPRVWMYQDGKLVGELRPNMTPPAVPTTTGPR